MPRMINSHGVTKKQTLHSISNVFKFRVISFNAYWKIRHESFFFLGGGGGGIFDPGIFLSFDFCPHSSSETQGQKVGARKSLSGRENIARRQLLCFSAQPEARKAATVWNWSGKSLSPRALLAFLYFSSCHIFPPV